MTMTKKDASMFLAGALLGAELACTINIYGEDLKEKNGWNVSNGRDAITVYLVNKHGWTVEHARSLSYESLKFALTEELKSFAPPEVYHGVSDQLHAFVQSLMKNS